MIRRAGVVHQIDVDQVPVDVVVVACIGPTGRRVDNGDWTLGTKVWLLAEKPKRPSFAFLYEVKLPNGSDEAGGVTDETDFFGYFLGSKGVGKKNVFHGNVGLGILGNPFDNASQNDVTILRFAWERKLSERRVFGIELVAQAGPEEDDDPAFAHAVYSQRIGKKFALYGGVAVGTNSDSDNFLADIGVRCRFKLWNPKEPVRRNNW